jgi:CHAT domain-containing protein/tetratricopeptide (TPR) repeat protein
MNPNQDTIDELNQLVVRLYTQGKYQEALNAAQRSAMRTKDTSGEEHPVYAQTLNNLATLYYLMGAFEKAEPLYLQAQEIWKKALGEEHPNYATSLNNLAELYRFTGAYEKAEPLFTQALQIRKKALGEEHPNYAQSLSNLALLYYSMGAYEKAEPLFRQALKIRKKALGVNHREYATSLNNLALLYYSLRDYEKAEPLFQQALMIRKKVLGEEHPEYAQSLNNLADLYLAISADEKAEPLFQEALKIRKKVLGEEHSEYAHSLNSLARFYDSIGSFEKAKSSYQKVVEINKKALGKDHPIYAQSLNNLATCYHSMGAYEKAEPLYQHAREIWKKALGKEHPNYAASLKNLADLYAVTHRTGEGLELMKKAAAINDRMIGQVFSIESEDQRLVYLSSIRPHVETFVSLVFQHFSQSPEAIRDALALVLKRKAITAEALAAQRDAILGGKYPLLRERFHQISLLRMQIAQKTLAGPGREGVEAYNRLLAEWNAEKERLETDLARQVPEIRLEESLRNADRNVIAHTLPPGSALIEFFRFDEFDFTAIPAKGQRQWKPARYCAFVLPSEHPDNVSLIDLGEADQIDQFIALYKSKLTGDERALLDTAPQTHQPHAQSGILSRLFGKKPQEEEARSSRDLGAIPTHAHTEMESKEGLQLYSALIAPLRDALGDCLNLIVAPDSQISTIPFEVIPTPEGGYLIDQYHLSYVGVGRDVLRFTADIPGKPGNAMIIASPDFDLRAVKFWKKSSDSLVIGRISRDFSRGSRHFTPLPGTKVEGNKIGSLLGIKPLLEQDALEAKLKSVSSPLILHIATHGFFLTDQEISNQKVGRNFGVFSDIDKQRLSGRGMENPMLRSGLALAGVNTWLNKGVLPPEAEDGILTAEDVSGLDLTNTALAVLSACDTGMGDIKTGEGVFGLRRAFSLAGAKTLVMSLWKVPDTPTQELMEDFYQRLLAGAPKADALREAQFNLRKKYPHPRDWGAFICQGDPGPIRGIK